MQMDYDLSTIAQFRTGDQTEPYIDITQSIKLKNQRAQLAEIPVYNFKVKVTGFVEKQEWDTTDIQPNQYRVDYNQGLVFFHSSVEGQTLTFIYKGKGNHYIASSRVWVEENNGEVVSTLKDLLDSGEEALDGLVQLADTIEQSHNATTAANNAATLANTTNATVSSAETARATAESTRVSNESTRVSNETARVSVETARVAAEAARNTAESGRTSAESTRATNETTRQSQESTRQSNESTRQSQETTRQTNITSAINNFNTITDSYKYDANAYNASTAYKVNNQISYNGSTYICILDSTGNLPTNTTYWRLFAAKGTDGMGTVTTLASASGDIVIGGTSTVPDLSIGNGKITSSKLATGLNLSGTVTSTTPAVGTNTTQIATTEFVINQAVSKTGGTMSGALTVNNRVVASQTAGREISAGSWGDMSSNSTGHFLIANNAYTADTNSYKYSNTHPSLGARGLVFMNGGGIKAFEMGAVATTQDGDFTPTLYDVLHSGNHNSTGDVHTQYVKKAGDTLTGSLTAPSIALTSGSAISMPAVNAGMEIGSITTSNTPFIDFHTSGTNIDYDVRIIASGGNGTIGMGGLTINAGGDTTFQGAVNVNGGSNGFKLLPSTADHTFMGFYARSASPSTRSGWLGYGGAGTNNMSLVNEATGGNLSISVTGSTSKINLTALGGLTFNGIDVGITRVNNGKLEFWDGSGWKQSGSGGASGTGTTDTNGNLTVGGLSFAPKYIIGYINNGYGYEGDFTCGKDMSSTVVNYYYYVNNGGLTYPAGQTSGFTLGSNGFTIKAHVNAWTGNNVTNVKWYAFAEIA